MVAVLPFAATSMDGESDFFATGVHDDLLTRLAKLKSLRVISRTSVLEYRGTTKNMRQIGTELGADVILEGGVQAAGDRLRINAQLINAQTDEHLWAETYDRDLSVANIFDIQSEIARAIANALNAALTVEDDQGLALIPTQNMAAYRAYRKAMEIWNKDGYESAYQEALEEAVRLDPGFVQAWVQLVGVYAIPNVGLAIPNPELTRQAEEAVQKVQALAPDSADYLVAQTYYIYYVIKDYEAAHDLVSKALAMRPNDIRVVMLKSYIERRQGNYVGRIESLRFAHQLDPLDLRLTMDYLNGLLMIHRYEEILAQIDSAPDTPEFGSFRAFFRLRETADFEQWLDTSKSLSEEYGEAFLFIDALSAYSRVPSGLWTAYVVNRDYSGAMQVFDRRMLVEIDDEQDMTTFFRRAIFTLWLGGNQSELDRYLGHARVSLERDLNEDGDYGAHISYLVRAMVAAVEGKGKELVQALRSWEQKTDPADLHGYRNEACWMLAMVKETAAAVQCIRDGLREPSLVIPFIEPHLPFYDSIREAPEFVELLTEIEAGKQAQATH